MKKYFVTCFLLLLAHLVYSEDNTNEISKNSLGLRIGYNQGYLKDLNFSPLNYKEGGAIYNFNYINRHAENKGILNLELDFSSANIKTTASKFLTSSLLMAHFEVAYLRRTTQKEKVSFFLGGQYSSYIQILDWQSYEAFSYLANHGIGLKGLIFYQFNSKHQLSSSLFIPIFQFLARPPYNGIDEGIIENQDNISRIIFNGKPTSFNKYIAIDWKVNYLFQLSKRFDLSAQYLLRYQKVSEINQMIHLQNQFTIGLNVKF